MRFLNTSRFIILIPLAFAVMEKSAIAQAPPAATITADKIIRDGKSGKVIATGDVVIINKEKTITADKATYNDKTGEGSAEGFVRVTDPESDLKGDKVNFSDGGDKVEIYNAIGTVSTDNRISGEKISKLGKGHYFIEEGTFTTCEDEKPHWQFDSGETDITIQKYAVLENMVFRVADIPVFYLPYMVVPISNKRTTGFLRPSFGLSSSRGFELGNAFFWAISENMDATVTHTHLGTAGEKFTAEFRYIFTPEAYGTITAEYLRETDPKRAAPRNLAKARVRHRMMLPMKVKSVVHVDYQSEESLDRTYSNNITSKSLRYTDSWASFSRSFDTRRADLRIRERRSVQSGATSVVQSLPEFKFNNQKEKLFGSPVYGALQTSYTGYKLSDTPDGGVEKTFDVNRAHISPTLLLPLKVAPWLSVTPSASYYLTNYSNGFINNGRTELKEGFTREYYSAEIDVTGPKFYRIFDTGSKTTPKLKHLLTPSIKWQYQPSFDVDGEDRKKVKIIDGIDSDGYKVKNGLKFQLINQLLAKKVIDPDNPTISELVKLTVTETFDINEANRTENPDKEKKPLGPVIVDLDTRLFDWLMVNYQSNYNVYDSFWETSQLEIGFKYKEILNFALDRSYKFGKGKDDQVWDRVYVGVVAPYNLTFDFSAIYNEVTAELHDSMFRAKYTKDCWSFGITISNRLIPKLDANGAESKDAVTGNKLFENEQVIRFNLTLKGIGSLLGAEKNPIARRKL